MMECRQRWIEFINHWKDQKLISLSFSLLLLKRKIIEFRNNFIEWNLSAHKIIALISNSDFYSLFFCLSLILCSNAVIIIIVADALCPTLTPPIRRDIKPDNILFDEIGECLTHPQPQGENSYVNKNPFQRFTHKSQAEKKLFNHNQKKKNEKQKTDDDKGAKWLSRDKKPVKEKN